jgi:hypothetical protein
MNSLSKMRPHESTYLSEQLSFPRTVDKHWSVFYIPD